MPNREDDRDDAARVIPGMRSDSEPQPTQDPDFGPGLEYESGDRNPDFTEADKIRRRWKQGLEHSDEPDQQQSPERRKSA